MTGTTISKGVDELYDLMGFFDKEERQRCWGPIQQLYDLVTDLVAMANPERQQETKEHLLHYIEEQMVGPGDRRRREATLSFIVEELRRRKERGESEQRQRERMS